MEIAAVVLGIAIFEAAAIIWGSDSRPAANDQEWERRRRWRGFGSGH